LIRETVAKSDAEVLVRHQPVDSSRKDLTSLVQAAMLERTEMWRRVKNMRYTAGMSEAGLGT
jgi:hypothetical protein